MKFLKNYESFITEEAQPATKPSPSPSPNPDTPTTEPGRRKDPGKRPSPVRRDKPDVAPGPKGTEAGKKKATEEEVAERFISLMNQKGESVKKYVK